MRLKRQEGVIASEEVMWVGCQAVELLEPGTASSEPNNNQKGGVSFTQGFLPLPASCRIPRLSETFREAPVMRQASICHGHSRLQTRGEARPSTPAADD